MDIRKEELTRWVGTQQPLLPGKELESVSGDASFRRYFRAYTEHGSFIAVDAPPAKEDSQPFLAIAQAWAHKGLPVPKIIAYSLEQGFMLLSDFGNQLLLPLLKSEQIAEHWYHQALHTLLKIADATQIPGWPLPPYDDWRLRGEMELFPTWFMEKYLQWEWQPGERALLERAFDGLIESALEQPQVCVHRDYHSRNLMALDMKHHTLGVLDFQDAVLGPVTYDVVSLLRDCYIAWPREKTEYWALHYAKQFRARHHLSFSDAQFIKWFDWMGAQRHLKCCGIFARLNFR
ncbi:MAG TPA: phosphotransferase, partial [Pseudomonadales bacterium]|nr:phosphotransferase [Pseudomonadales bacterium]